MPVILIDTDSFKRLREEGHEPAALAPQDPTGRGGLAFDSPEWVWVAVAAHTTREEWWDGSDYHDPAERPAFRPLPDLPQQWASAYPRPEVARISPDPKACAVKVTDDLGNVAIIRHTVARGWACTLGNGIPAAMSYAGIPHNAETETTIALERAATPEDVFRIVKDRVASSRFVVELI